jgi:hypothetical protein
MARRSGESGQAPTQDGHARFERKTLSDALDAVGQLNEQLLAVLVRTAGSDSSQTFPMADSLRSRFARLTAEQCKAISRCGVLLADAQFTRVERWLNVGSIVGTDAVYDAGCHWLGQDEAIALCFAVLMVAWHVVHTAPTIAGVLLGMSESVLTRYRDLGVNELVAIAQSLPCWIRPRWADSPEVWTGIIDLATDPLNSEPSKLALHCLKLSAGSSARLIAPDSSHRP